MTTYFNLAFRVINSVPFFKIKYSQLLLCLQCSIQGSSPFDHFERTKSQEKHLT